ncbi:MAG: hypothetical protein K9L30_01030 [Desulfobacterales bacterium]|nr:hypothetical protein [Desulfobacterales bacterium]
MPQSNLNENDRKGLEPLFIKHGCHNFRCIASSEIVAAQWARDLNLPQPELERTVFLSGYERAFLTIK